jgi:hypothetical protein
MSFRESAASAENIKTANGWLTVFFMANFPPVIALYLTMSSERFQSFCLLYLALISIWACVGTHFAGWVAGRTEVKVEAQDATVEHADEVTVND